MIRSFATPATRLLFDGIAIGGLPMSVQQRALMKLQMLHAAGRLEDLRRVVPFDPARHCVTIDGRAGLCFRWDGSDAHEVELVGFH
jgi:toxin HigB-1